MANEPIFSNSSDLAEFLHQILAEDDVTSTFLPSDNGIQEETQNAVNSILPKNLIDDNEENLEEMKPVNPYMVTGCGTATVQFI